MTDRNALAREMRHERCQCPQSSRMPGRCPGPAFCPCCEVRTYENEEEDLDAPENS
jgi:hypothetical protein